MKNECDVYSDGIIKISCVERSSFKKKTFGKISNFLARYTMIFTMCLTQPLPHSSLHISFHFLHFFPDHTEGVKIPYWSYIHILLYLPSFSLCSHASLSMESFLVTLV